MSDKKAVTPILLNFIKSCAYLGHTQDYDIEVLLQIYTTIFKEPSDCLQDIDSLIDLILLIALQNQPDKNLLPPKSRDFIDKSLDYIDMYFCGENTLDVKLPS